MLRLAVLHGLALQPLLSCTAAAAAAAAAPRTSGSDSGSNRAPQPQAAAAAAGPLLSLGHGQLQHLFENGDGHYDCFRCPGAVRTHRSILVFVESRRNCSDLGSRNWGQDRFPPRKTMSSYFLLEWGVQIPCIFHENQTPRSGSTNFVETFRTHFRSPNSGAQARTTSPRRTSTRGSRSTTA